MDQPHIHQPTGPCIVCNHHGDDCTGTLSGDPASCPARLLVLASQTQADYWTALRALEVAVGLDLEDVGELHPAMTVAGLIESFGPNGLAETDEAILMRHWDDYGEDPGHGADGPCASCKEYSERFGEPAEDVAANLRRAEIGGAQDPRNDR